MRLVYCLLLVIAALPTLGQSGTDKIYLPSGDAVAGTITALTTQTIAYTAGTAEQSLPAGRWVLAIKQTGEFALPGRAATWQAGADPKAHRIITRDGGIVTARSLSVTDHDLTYLPIEVPQRQSLSKQEVALVIYRDGRHQLMASPADAARGLAQLSLAPNPTANKKSDEISADGGEVLVLDDERKAHFEKMALVKANDFGKYLSIVSDKDEVEEDKLMAVSHAVMLFMSDSSKIQVSSLNSDSKQYTVPVYLDRLRMLPYDKVELLWVKAMMVSKFRKGVDGRYYGMIAAQQLFRGYLDNEIVYQDVTEKDIEVVLDQYVVFDEGKRQKKWDVLLSSVNVKQTREK
ncbi:MAG: hypothetical protein WA958_19305 [Tunicatimonas sp.]